MPYTLVATGDVSSLPDLEQYEDRFNEGDYGRLDLDLKSSIAADAITWLSNKLSEAGLTKYKVAASDKILQIHFKKEIAPLAIIAWAIAAGIFIWFLIIAWKLWRLSAAASAAIAFGIPLLIVGAILLIVYIGGKIVAGPVTIGK